MKGSIMATSVALAWLCTAASPVHSGIRPYLRAGFGGSQMLMSDVNSQIAEFQNSLASVNIPSNLHKVGPGVGPFGSAGLWLFPGCLRIGATYSYQRSTLENRVHQPGVLFYDDQLDFRMTEIGGEVAVRVPALAGLTFTGQMGQGHGQLKEGYSWEDAGGNLYEDTTAERTRTTYGAFLGLDQTNEAGLAGFIRAGYVWRNIGSMPSSGLVSDGVNSAWATGQSVPMNFSGFCVQLGVGFDAFTPRPE